MINTKIDTSKSPKGSWYVKSVGAELHLVYEYDNEKVDLIILASEFKAMLKECGGNYGK